MNMNMNRNMNVFSLTTMNGGRYGLDISLDISEA